MTTTDPLARPNPAPEPAPKAAAWLRRLRPWLWGATGLACLGLGALLAQHWLPAATSQSETAIGGHFSLVDRDGRIVTPQTLRGTPYAIFFGFTRCPDVCPTTLARLARLRGLMGPDGERLRIIFVSVDAAHDRPADVGAYVDLFGTPILGLTGSEQQIEEAARAFRVYYRKVPLPGGGDTIDHSAFVILMDRDGHFKSLLSDQDSEQQALAELRALVA